MVVHHRDRTPHTLHYYATHSQPANHPNPKQRHALRLTIASSSCTSKQHLQASESCDNTIMEPPEQTKPIHHYTLGETGKPEHIANFPTPNDTLLAVANLKPHDPCFVLRSGGNFTFAKIISRQRHQDTITFIVQVNDTGSTKTIPFDRIAEY